MSHSTEERPSASRVERYLQFMIYVLRADGVVDPAEKEHLLSLMTGGLKLEPGLVERFREALEAQTFHEPTDAELMEVVDGLDPDSLAHLVRDAYGLAACDGEVHPQEWALITRTLALAGIPPDRYTHIESWAQHALELARVGTLLFDAHYRDSAQS